MRGVHVVLLLACILVAVWQVIPVVVVLLLAGVVSDLPSWWRAASKQTS